MTFREIMVNCDSLFPNTFSESEKMSFMYELASLIHIGYIKEMKNVTFGGGSNGLPSGVTADRVRSVYFDGKLQGGTNLSELLKMAGDRKVSVDYIYVPDYGLDDTLPVGAPFDAMFQYWLLAKICLHTDDIEGFNNYMNLYNGWLLEYKKQYAANESSGKTRFKNLW